MGFLHYWLSTNCHGRPYKEDITLCILETLHLTKIDVNQMSMNHMCLLGKKTIIRILWENTKY